LFAGASGNPIILGYTAGFTFLAALTMSMRSKSIPSRLIWLALSILGFMVCSFTGTRSALLSCMVGAILLLTYFLNIVGKTVRSSFRFFSSSVSVAGIILALLLIFLPATNSSSANVSFQESSPVIVALENGISRLDTLTKVEDDQERDASAEARTKIYANAWSLIQESPVLGSGLYSAGMAHNAGLQIMADFGILGVATFTVPFLYLTYVVFKKPLRDLIWVGRFPSLSPQAFIRSDTFLINCFMFIMWLQVMFGFSFHGDPYRNSTAISTLGLLSAFSHLSQRERMARRHS
jgi:O-antigen ligase